MKNLETYESFFKNFKNLFKKDDKVAPDQAAKWLKISKNEEPKEVHPADDERYMSKERKDEISDTIVDCIQDVLDEYGIYNSNNKEWINVMMWAYIKDNDGVKSGVEIYNIRQSVYDNLVSDINEKKNMIESVCGVRVTIIYYGGDFDYGLEYGENDSDATIQIEFPFYEQDSYDVQKERAKKGYH